MLRGNVFAHPLVVSSIHWTRTGDACVEVTSYATVPKGWRPAENHVIIPSFLFLNLALNIDLATSCSPDMPDKEWESNVFK